MTRILAVTGGSGFVGSNFVRHWLARHPGDVVLNIDALTCAAVPETTADIEEGYPERYLFENADVADFGAIQSIFERYRPTLVVHLAAESHNSRALVDPVECSRTNAHGTQVVLEAARRTGVTRVHYVSTCEVYGELSIQSEAGFSEDNPPRPTTPYAASKAAGELAVLAAHRSLGMNVTISVSCNNYGPYQSPEKLIPKLLMHALRDRPLLLYKDAASQREWIHVLDHCAAIESIILNAASGSRLNVGSGVELSIDEIASAVETELGLEHLPRCYVESRPGHDRRYLLNTERIHSTLGWRAVHPLAMGLAETVRWYKGNTKWCDTAARRSFVGEESWSRR